MKPETKMLAIFMVLQLLACSACNQRHIRSLYVQKIPYSNLVIYRYVYYGGFVTSGDNEVSLILDSNKKFSPDFTENEIPVGYFISNPTAKIIELAEFYYPRSTEGDTLLTPVKKYEKTVAGITLKGVIYKATYGSPICVGSMKYEFDDLVETSDSLTFKNIRNINSCEEFALQKSFVKGSIDIVETDDGNVEYILIEKLIIKRGAIYKPTEPMVIVNNRPVVGIATYYFHPRKKIPAKMISNFGVFKKVF